MLTRSMSTGADFMGKGSSYNTISTDNNVEMHPLERVGGVNV